jgi:hypothetical protein
MPLWAEESPLFGRRFLELKTRALESLGAGYYSFGSAKHRLYNEARGCLGAALGLLYSEPTLRERYAEEIAFIEDKCLPAFAALLKKMERPHSRGHGARSENLR